MTHALTTAAIPAPTPMHASSLSPPELAAHRQAIAFEVRTVLSAYFQPHESEEIRASQLAWWCDELQDWHREQIVWALRKWNREHPRHRPTPGDIATICKAERGRRHAAPGGIITPLRPILGRQRWRTHHQERRGHIYESQHASACHEYLLLMS